MPLSSAIAQFLREFAVFETRYVGMALRSLTADHSLIEQAQSRLHLNARLTLLKRMAMVRAADSRSVAELDRIIARTARLQDKREELTRTLVAAAEDAPGISKSTPNSAASAIYRRIWVPTVEEMGDCNVETADLQESLRSIAEGFRSGSATPISQVPEDNLVRNSDLS